MIKNCLLVVTILTAACTARVTPTEIVDWIDFVQFNGIQYIAVYNGDGSAGRDLTEADLGPEFAKVEYKHDEPHVSSHECCRDGDAAFLEAGTVVYIVKGYHPGFRLAAYRDGRLVLFEADSNPKAQTGADLLDIGGKVDSIRVISAEDGVTELASIADPKQVAALVELVLGSPVDQTRLMQGGVQVYFIAFHLMDGTIVTLGFLPDSGELHRGILLPEAFATAVEQALSAATPSPP